jgi:hypothetical protein
MTELTEVNVARRKRSTAEFADALGAGTEPSGFAATDVLSVDPEEMLKRDQVAVETTMSRPDVDPGSEAVGFAGLDAVSELEKVLSEEEPNDAFAGYEKLSPKAKEVFLATYQPDPLKHIFQNSPMFIDKEAVPEKVFLFWLSRYVSAEIGWRGFTPVPNTEETRKWVPNLRLHPSQRYVMSGRMVLGFKSKAEWLRDWLRQLKEVNATREDVLRQFAPALRSRHSDFGLTMQQALQIEAELGGMVSHRGPDPHNLPHPDIIKGEGE